MVRTILEINGAMLYMCWNVQVWFVLPNMGTNDFLFRKLFY